MSLDFTVTSHVCPHCGRATEWESWNYTYNVSEMLRQAAHAVGFQDTRMLECLEGPCARAADRISRLVEELTNNSAVYRALEPYNKWGSLDSIVEELGSLREMCLRHPTATLVADR